MKIKGASLKGPNVVDVVIPRGDGAIHLRCQAVLDYSLFEKLLPRPAPPEKMIPGGEKSVNWDDPDYKKQLEEWGSKQYKWIILKSLEATEALEWENVRIDEPKTYGLLDDELKAAGFSVAERNMIWNGVAEANGVDDSKIKQARARFLSGATQAVAR